MYRAAFSTTAIALVVTMGIGNASASAEPARQPNQVPEDNQSGQSIDVQFDQCAIRAREAGVKDAYGCAVVAEGKLKAELASVKDVQEKALLPIQEWQTRRNDTSNRAIAPICDQGYSNPNRFTSCSAEGWVVQNWRIVNGVRTLIGQMDLSIFSSVEFDEADDGDMTPGWDLDSEVHVTYTWGNLQAGTSGRMWTGCWNRNDVCSTGAGNIENEPVTLAPLSITTKAYSQYSDTMAVHEVNPLYGHLGSAVYVNTPAGPVTIADHQSNTLWGRCDGDSENRYGNGCVDDLGPAYVLYDTQTNPAVGPVAQHVFDAIRGLPSQWGSPYGSALTRLRDQAQIDSNRAITCGNVTTPPLQSCDEYPMASTYQGGNGAAANDRSIRIVPLSANNSQGGLTSAYYDYYRILAADPFFVQAVLADGSTAW